jgi:hypothetical protein
MIRNQSSLNRKQSKDPDLLLLIAYGMDYAKQYKEEQSQLALESHDAGFLVVPMLGA